MTAPTRTVVVTLAAAALAVAACTDGPRDPGDADACAAYADAVDAAEAGATTDAELLDELEDAWRLADSAQLQDGLEDALDALELGDAADVDLADALGDVRSACRE